MTNNQRAVATRPAIEPNGAGTSLLLSTPREVLEVIRKAIAPGISDVDLELFLREAQEAEVSPLAVPPEIWAVPRKAQVNGQWVTKYVPTMGIDGWRKKLSRTGLAQESVIEWCGPDGVWCDVWLSDGPPAAARASIWITGRDRPQRFVCTWQEFHGDSQLWRDKPAHMLSIRALSHCIKEVLRAIGAFVRASSVEVGEWEPSEVNPEGVARAAFWASVTDMGLDDASVRRALQVPEGASLSDTVDRMGGWRKALVYVESRAPGLVALPPGASASDLLYRQDDDPVALRREQADQAIQHFAPPQEQEAAASVRLDGETQVAEPPPDDDDAYLGICSAEGCRLPATGYAPDGEGVLCDAHLRGDPPEADSSREGAEAEALPPCPQSVHDLPSLVAAMGALGATRADLAKLGRLPGNGAGREAWVQEWDALARLMASVAGPLG